MKPSPMPEENADALRQQVLAWFTRRQGADWNAADEAAFQAWQAQDPARHAAVAHWEAHWQTLDALPADAIARLRAGLARDKAAEIQAPPPAASTIPPARPAFARSRRRFLPAFALTASLAVGLAGYIAWDYSQTPLFSHSYASARGEQAQLRLPDGSELLLDTGTRVEVAYYRGRREVKLIDGQAMFSVQADSERPFQVAAGAVKVTVVGTRFAVRHTPQVAGASATVVSVEHGRVRVATRDGLPAGELLLVAGQRVESDTLGLLTPVAAVPPEDVAPWREHRISFVDVTLAQAVAEMERYGDTRIRLSDPALAALRLSGTFDPRDLATFRRILPRALPIRLQEHEGALEVQARADAPRTAPQPTPQITP